MSRDPGAMSHATCPVCGRDECGLHDGVVAFAELVDRFALIGIGLLSSLIVMVIAFAAE